MPNYQYLAVDCPTPQGGETILDPAGGPTTLEGFTVGEAAGRAAKHTRNAAKGDAIGRWGGGAYAVAIGLDLILPPSGLTLEVSPGQAMIDGPVTKTAATNRTLAISDNVNRALVWLTQAGTLVAMNNDLTRPTARCVFLGSVRSAGGNLVDVDYSGRGILRGGVLWRRTADVAAPGDAPSSALMLYTRTHKGLYLWDSTEHIPIDSPLISDLQSELEIEQLARLSLEDRFRRLILYLASLGLGIPPGLEDDLCQASWPA
jgi:hypothetical protein